LGGWLKTTTVPAGGPKLHKDHGQHHVLRADRGAVRIGPLTSCPAGFAERSPDREQNVMITPYGMPRRMLIEESVLEIVPVSRSTLLRMVKAGTFPKPTYISKNRRCWFEDEIVEWQNSVNEFQPGRGRGGGRRKAIAPVANSASIET
jgi:prophage regulatory protein